MQAVNNRNSFGRTSIEYAWRQKREKILDMCNINLVVSEGSRNMSPGRDGPGVPEKQQSLFGETVVLYLHIIAFKHKHLVTTPRQHISFGVSHGVLAAHYLITVVNLQNPHAPCIPALKLLIGSRELGLVRPCLSPPDPQ